jgi:anthranilate phosphoribosyltransferase
VSSRCGSADVLEALGVRIDLSPATSPPASTRSASASCSPRPTTRPCATPARCARAGVRTVFNLLGPLTNPAGARRQVIGVYAEPGGADRAGAGSSWGTSTRWSCTAPAGSTS